MELCDARGVERFQMRMQLRFLNSESLFRYSPSRKCEINA